ncbi:MAG: Asp-tRNA(Asn)/Glu-tRNA(Gln) amidotransferase subunit GatA, partial [Ruminococcus sp.]
MKLYEKTASELSEMLAKKECSAVEIYNDVKSRIDSVEDKVGAYVTLNENALEQAKEVDNARAN